MPVKKPDRKPQTPSQKALLDSMSEFIERIDEQEAMKEIEERTNILREQIQRSNERARTNI